MGIFGKIGELYEIVRNYIVALPLKVWEWLRSFFMQEVAMWVIGNLPEDLRVFFERIDVSFIAGLVSDLTWLFPFWQCLAVLSAGYSICGAIRLVRHVLGFVPFTNAG